MVDGGVAFVIAGGDVRVRLFDQILSSLLFFLPAAVEMMPHAVHRELHTARQSELVQNHRELVFDRLQTEAQARCDFTVRLALADEGDDLLFAPGQCRCWLVHACNPIWQSWSLA
jgi:hypothetical protein